MKNSLGLQLESEQRNFLNFRWGGKSGKFYRKRACEGFTLVELIVVIVILAILAAILVPGLLGWIDKAKLSKYELEARSIAQAAQGEAIKLYGKREGMTAGSSIIQFSDVPDNVKNEEGLLEIIELSGIDDIDLVNVYCDSADNWNIKAIWIIYTSDDGKSLNAVWNVNKLPGNAAEDFKDMYKDKLKGAEDGWLFAVE